jgi:hypothetical protein
LTVVFSLLISVFLSSSRRHFFFSSISFFSSHHSLFLILQQLEGTDGIADLGARGRQGAAACGLTATRLAWRRGLGAWWLGLWLNDDAGFHGLLTVGWQLASFNYAEFLFFFFSICPVCLFEWCTDRALVFAGCD